MSNGSHVQFSLRGTRLRKHDVPLRTARAAVRHTVRQQRPHESSHLSGSWASRSPVTDGVQLIASFGSRGVYSFDFSGTLPWAKDFRGMQIKPGHGQGSSPALYGDTVIINWDHEGQSFVGALDKRTGKQRWKMDREEATSWSSPRIVEHGGKP